MFVTSRGKSKHGPLFSGRDTQEGGQSPSTEALQSPLGATSRRAPYSGRERFDRATWGAASRRPKLLCSASA
eukprot:15451166-Alexandrium_andersonii.AAC.1